MGSFFKYDNPITDGFYDLTFLEWIIPITLVYTIVLIFIIYKVKIKEVAALETVIRYSMGLILSALFITNYILIWINEGLSVHNLPINFYSFCIITCVLLIFTKKERFYALVLFSGIIGGMVNMLTNQVGYSYQYFRYYQFMASYGLIIIVPIYFLIVHDYLPSIKRVLESIIIMQVVIVGIFIFNHIFETNYMYLTFGENTAYSKIIISQLGKWPWYIIWLELSVVLTVFAIYGIIHVLYRQYEKAKNDRLEHTSISQQSIYISKKKKY